MKCNYTVNSRKRLSEAEFLACENTYPCMTRIDFMQSQELLNLPRHDEVHSDQCRNEWDEAKRYFNSIL